MASAPKLGRRAAVRLPSRVILLCTALAVFLVAPVGSVRAAVPGLLDSTFGSGGISATAPDNRLLGTAVQSDGKVLAVGETSAATNATLLLVRFTSSGAFDRAFGAGGLAKGPAVSGTADAGSLGRGVAIQPDGRIVVVGKNTSPDGSARDGLLVERFTANGRLDRSFGSSGVVNVLTGNSFGDGYAVAVQRDGRIVATGTADTAGTGGTTPRVAVVRLNPNGSPDASFASAGVDILDLGPDAYALAVALQSDRKIVVAGSQGSSALIARLTPAGARDPGFAGTGASVNQYGRNGVRGSVFNGLAIGPNGSIVAAGGAADGHSKADALVVRFMPSGTPDRTFGTIGAMYTPSAVNWSFTSTPTIPGANSVALAPDGNIVLAGDFANSIVTYATVWALSPHGGVVRSFGHGGASVLTNSDGTNTEYAAVAPVGSTGDFVAAGNTVPFGGASTGIAVRYIGFGPPPLQLTLVGLRRAYQAAAVGKHGLKLVADCNEACAIKLSLTMSARQARQLRLSTRNGAREATLARAGATLASAGGKTFIVRFSRSLLAAVHRQKRVSITLIVSATSTVTHKGHTTKQSITLTP